MNDKKSDIKDTDGFEELIEALTGNRVDAKRKIQSKSKNHKLHDDFELLNHLENELERIERINSFFGERILFSQKFTQNEKLIKRQKAVNNRKKKEILDYLVDQGSPINRKIRGLMFQLFSKN